MSFGLGSGSNCAKLAAATTSGCGPQRAGIPGWIVVGGADAGGRRGARALKTSGLTRSRSSLAFEAVSLRRLRQNNLLSRPVPRVGSV